MIQVRRSDERGASRTSWLESRHSFSFADYHDPEHMGFRALRVLNEDWIAPASGFAAHPHRDMEIFTYPVSGVVEHRDSAGSHSRLPAGCVQLMTAGSGIVHSEVNPSSEETLHLLQIWLLPDRPNHAPAYQERAIEPGAAALQPLVTPDGREGTLRIHQDATIYRLQLPAGGSVEHAVAPGRHAWLQMIRGGAELNGVPLVAGDGASASGIPQLTITAEVEVEALLFDLA